MDYGFRAVIAGSFSDIFYMNATKNGLLPIVLSLSARQVLAALAPDERIAIDLPKQHVTVKQTVYPFEIDATWKHKLVNGLDEIGITLQEEKKITAYEKTIPHYRRN